MRLRPASILARRSRQVLFECTLEVRLVREADVKGHFHDWHAASQLRTTILNTSIDQIGMRRHPELAFERAYQVGLGKIGRRANFIEIQGAHEIVADKFRSAHELPASTRWQCGRRVERLLHGRKKTDCRALLLQLTGMLVRQHGVKTIQTCEQSGGRRCRERSKVRVAAKSKLMLKFGKPGHIHIQHAI